MPIPPKSKFSKLKEKGVQKTINNSNFSKEKKAKKTITKTTGKSPSQKNSLAKRTLFTITKSAVNYTS